MILVFDLDDTLYDEQSFVKSGMKAVSHFLSTLVNIPSDKIEKQLLQILKKNGRGKVFDIILKEYNLYSAGNLKKCIDAYRSHIPQIHLYPDAKRCLTRFNTYPKYIVTDGHKWVQLNKLKALDLNKFVVKAYRTYQYGLKYSKPSTYCFELIQKKEKIKPSELIYIGDNPNKDFINLKKNGFKTVRILRGMFNELRLDKDHEADVNIVTLDELTLEFLDKLIKKK